MQSIMWKNGEMTLAWMQVDQSKGYYSTQESVFEKMSHDVFTGNAKKWIVLRAIQEIIYAGFGNGLNMGVRDRRDFWLVQPNEYWSNSLRQTIKEDY